MDLQRSSLFQFIKKASCVKLTESDGGEYFDFSSRQNEQTKEPGFLLLSQKTYTDDK